MPAARAERQLRGQPANGALYLLASAPFPSTRLQLQLPETGERIPLDLSAATTTPARLPIAGPRSCSVAICSGTPGLACGVEGQNGTRALAPLVSSVMC